MSELHQRLANGFPDRVAPTRASIPSDAKGITQWVAALPLANPLSASRVLLQGIHDLNGLRLDPSVRLHALETLRSPMAQLVAQADRQVIGSTFPLPHAKQQLGLQSREFHEAFALGYRTVVHDLCLPAGKLPFLKGGTAALASARAIDHYGESLLRGYLLYQTPSPGVWQSLHDLYRFTDAIGVVDKTVADPLLGKAVVTPKRCYAHVLLLAISNPYRLAQKEMADAHEVMRAWALYCDLSMAGGENDFDVAQDQDRGPGYSADERQAAGAQRVAFSAARAQQYLERELSLTSISPGPLGFGLKGGPKSALGQDLIRRLCSAWRPQFDRNHSRLSAGHELETLIGLHAIHFHLAGQLDFENFVRELRGPGISLSERDKTASWAQGSGEGSRALPTRAQVLDQSLGGYRLQWGAESGAKARIGELVGLASPEEDDAAAREWMVGVIRWLRFTLDGQVDAGVELLARQAEPAALRISEAGSSFKTPVRAIELEPLHPGNGGLSFLAPSIGERSFVRMEVSMRPERYSETREPRVSVIADIDLLENTGAYLRVAAKAKTAENSTT
ncbi:MAG: hypothetical protein IPF83_10955 [Rhodanobacteraceae bacterium]|nr:hypothetical protein [Rhodanobacteraceae bacterium]MBP9153616.1 hypothetical protein [Xanthomonadales bacterium]